MTQLPRRANSARSRDLFEEEAARHLAEGHTHEAVAAKLMADEGLTLYEANFVVAGAISRAARPKANIEELSALDVPFYRDPHMLILVLGAIAMLSLLFS